MSSLSDAQATPPIGFPLLALTPPDRVLARHRDRDISQREYLEHVHLLARQLPERRYLINLCGCSYHFLVAFGAALLRVQTNLLPSSRAEQVVAELHRDWEGSYVIDDARVAEAIDQAIGADVFDMPMIDAAHVAVIGFTSGSTGQPRPHPKTWGGFIRSTANNLSALHPLVAAGSPFSVLATVPPQHMYGIEMSVLMPLHGGARLYTRRDLFPADIAASLADLPSPRVLVSTPIHLHAVVASGHPMPPIAAVVSATAPLSQELARAVESTLAAPVVELFGSTETCVIAHRRTAHDLEWQLMDEVTLAAQPGGTLVNAPWFAQPTLLQDIIECLPERRFVLRGRHADQIEIAGKRASLAELTRRLLAIDGVQDAAVMQEEGAQNVRRLAALVVAPDVDVATIVAALRSAVDPAFVPRRIVKLARLPRNAVGKLPRQALLECLRMPDQTAPE